MVKVLHYSSENSPDAHRQLEEALSSLKIYSLSSNYRTLHRFAFCTPEVLSYLLRCYCMSFYGCAVWDLTSPSIKSLDVCMNKVLRRIWSLPYNSHSGILHVVSNCCSVYSVCYNRFCKLFHRAKSSNNKLVHSVFSVLSSSCRNYIGYIDKYGFSFVRKYTFILCYNSVD